jgi:two-component system response regulator PilR (NtrC family)
VGSILVLDDERSLREFLSICLSRAGHKVTAAEDPQVALRTLASGTPIDLVITDLKMPGPLDGLGVLDAVKKDHPEIQVIVMTAFASTDTAIAAMKGGAYDYLTKPFKVDEILERVKRALERQALVRDNALLREKVQEPYRLSALLGRGPSMQRVFDLIRKIAGAKTSVLITGESGTGKELVARALHGEGARAHGPFVAVNCGAIPETLIESELFGHLKGAFTGATGAKEGLFAAAEGGTLFLDEIAELPLAMQVKLLRALQERKVKPVGGTEERPVDVRVVAATNRDLEAEVASGGFRQDLYYRLNVIQVHLPPLRQRREDIPLLVEHFVRRYAAELGKRVTGVSPEALAALARYDYPGNVRELENIVERAVTLETGSVIGRDALPELGRLAAAPAAPVELPSAGVDLDALLADYERDLVGKALRQSGGVRREAARILGITFRSLRYRLAKLGLAAGDAADASTQPDEGE